MQLTNNSQRKHLGIASRPSNNRAKNHGDGDLPIMLNKRPTIRRSIDNPDTPSNQNQ